MLLVTCCEGTDNWRIILLVINWSLCSLYSTPIFSFLLLLFCFLYQNFAQSCVISVVFIIRIISTIFQVLSPHHYCFQFLYKFLNIFFKLYILNLYVSFLTSSSNNFPFLLFLISFIEIAPSLTSFWFSSSPLYYVAFLSLTFLILYPPSSPLSTYITLSYHISFPSISHSFFSYHLPLSPPTGSLTPSPSSSSSSSPPCCMY